MRRAEDSLRLARAAALSADEAQKKAIEEATTHEALAVTVSECHQCYGLAPIGGDCPSPRCVAFREWALAHQDDEEKTP